MPDGWIRGCVHGAMSLLELPQFGEPGYAGAEAAMERVYQDLQTTDNRRLADEYQRRHDAGALAGEQQSLFSAR